MKSSDPPAIVNDIAPNGFYAIHRFRENDADAGGVALVHAVNVHAAAVSISTTISVSSVDVLVVKVQTRRGRLNIAAVYRPPRTSKHAITVGQFCSELGVLLDELLALPGQLIICGDFNCPGDQGIDVQLIETGVAESRSARRQTNVQAEQEHIGRAGTGRWVRHHVGGGRGRCRLFRSLYAVNRRQRAAAET